MAWIQMRFVADTHHAEMYENLLMAIGAKAVTFLEPNNQPLYESAPYSYPMWDQPIMVSLFTGDQPVDALAMRLKTLFEEERNEPFPDYNIEILEDQVWETAWADHFKPMAFGNRLWVCPSWHQPPAPDAINLILDPGMAFGTGTHATTRLCLEWLDQRETLEGLNVCDYGCGSGILGIAALKLGATQLTAVDIDPKALTETTRNAEQNQVNLEQIQLYLPDEQPPSTFEIVIANILAGPLLELADTLQTLTAPGGQILLSGILEEQAEEVMNHYQQWFDLVPYTVDEGWVRISGHKRMTPTS